MWWCTPIILDSGVRSRKIAAYLSLAKVIAKPRLPRLHTETIPKKPKPDVKDVTPW